MARSRRTIYLAGPMTASGRDDFNYPVFEKIASDLEDRGWAVHNPATTYNGSMTLPYRFYMPAAINLLLQSEAIALMDGWEESRGATMEALIAQRLELPFYNAHSGRRMSIEDLEVKPPVVLDAGREKYPRNEDLMKALEPVARDLARNNGDGITVTDVRREALEQGILTGDESPGRLSILGHVMRRAGLVHVGTSRRSDLDVTHGIRQTVWFEDLSLAPDTEEEAA